MNKITLRDLPDLSDWGKVPILTIDQAALLWGGIDPIFHSDIHFIEQLECKINKSIHIEQYRRAIIAKQAFCGGIILKTLQVHDLYLFDNSGNFREIYKANQTTDAFSFADIDTSRTTVSSMVLIAWAEKANCTTLRQTLKQREKQELQAVLNAPPPLVQIEYKQYKPKHYNPELETAIEINQEIYDQCEEGVKPPKKLKTQEIVEKKLQEKKGVKPLPAEISRVDTLARPECFKNQQSTKKD